MQTINEIKYTWRELNDTPFYQIIPSVRKASIAEGKALDGEQIRLKAEIILGASYAAKLMAVTGKSDAAVYLAFQNKKPFMLKIINDYLDSISNE